MDQEVSIYNKGKHGVHVYMSYYGPTNNGTCVHELEFEPANNGTRVHELLWTYQQRYNGYMRYMNLPTMVYVYMS